MKFEALIDRGAQIASPMFGTQRKGSGILNAYVSKDTSLETHTHTFLFN